MDESGPESFGPVMLGKGPLSLADRPELCHVVTHTCQREAAECF